MASAFKEIGDKLADFVEWVKGTLEDDDIRRAIAEDLGLQPGESVPKVNLPQDKVDSITRYRSQANPDQETFIILLQDVRAVYESLRSFISALGVSGVTAQNELLYQLFDLLALNYVRLREPSLYFIVQALGALVEDSSELVEEDASVERFLRTLGKAVVFALSPFYYFVKTFTAKDEAAARRTSERVFPHLAAALAIFAGQKEIILGWDSYQDPAQLRLSVRDVPSFAVRVIQGSDPLAMFLKGRLTALLLLDQGSGVGAESLMATLVEDLNKVLKDDGLFDEQRFAHVRVPERVLNLAAQKPQGDDLVRLNMALLEAAYPDDLWRSPRPMSDQISERMLTFAFPLSEQPSSGSDIAGSLDLSLAVIPETHAHASGLLIGVGGEGELGINLTDRWKFALQASAQPAFSVFLDTKLGNITGHGPVTLPLNIALVSIPDANDVTYALPDADGTRVEIGQLSLALGFDGKNGGVKAEARRCALVLATKDQDGFLTRVLPRDGLRVPFSFGFGFSTERRFFKEGNIDWPTGRVSPSTQPQPGPSSFLARRDGGGVGRRSMVPAARGEADGSQNIPNLSGTNKPELGVQAVIHIGKALLGARLDHLTLGLSPASDSAGARAQTEVSVSLALKLGPVTAVVERIGFEMELAFPESGGNVGFADFSMGFKAPTGAGIKVDAAVVRGGGFLFLDREKGQYAGFVELVLHDFVTVKAIGIITTRLPSGAKGFSLLVMITAEGFRPLRMGPTGWSLTAVGGMVAINRTCNVEFLREGIKNQTLDDLFFPKDLILNATRIFGTLNNAFPPQDGNHLLGIMVQVTWGAPPILVMDLGLIGEFSGIKSLRRLVILGRVRAIMPSEKRQLVRLQMNAIGVIDFEQNSFSLDAILYDSRLGAFPLTGGMAMRLNWGAAPAFALSIGGFHPAFKAPANFPVLDRLAISFSNTERFRLRAECYVAITSNTVQFGAKLELFAKAGKFSIEGRVGFDVLVQFSPFGYVAGLYASVQLKMGSRNLLKVKVTGELSGPRPMHIKGKATFEIFWCDFSVGFDKTLVEGEPPPQLESVNVAEQLSVALNDARNWSGQLAEGERRLVTLREAAAPDQISLHPLGRLSVKQNVVPLELEIARFGNTTPQGARLFKITGLSVNGQGVAFDREKDFFAPAQFLALSDDEKLAAPSFERMTAGLSVGAESFLFATNDADILEDEAITYETIIVDREREEEDGKPREKPPLFAISAEFLDRHIALGAAARSELRQVGAARYAPAAGKNALAKKGWTIASTEDGSPQGAPGLAPGAVVSYAESFQALQTLKRENPTRAKTLMLVRV